MSEELLQGLIGSRVKRIFFNEDYLRFETDKGNFNFCVYGDCCSKSVFYDFYGVKKLLAGNEVVSVGEVALKPSDIKRDENGDEKDKKSYQESISVYGYEIVTKDPALGEVTSVFSFRNYSNGYYGGSLEEDSGRGVLPEIFDDVLETVENPNRK